MTFNRLRELMFSSSTDAKTTRTEEKPSDIHNEIFSAYSYATLKPDAQEEITHFLENFYAGCLLFNAGEGDEQKLKDELKKIKARNVIALLNGKLYYAEFDKTTNTHVLSLVTVPENESIRVEARDALIKRLNKLTVAVPIDATRDELRQVRQVSDCMRFKTPAVLSIFDKRHSRQEALLNSDALLDNVIPDALAFYNESQVVQLDEALRFAIMHYLAQAQAAEDYIGPIKSPHTEIAACYRKIKLCTLYRLQLKIRQLQIDLNILEKTADADKRHAFIQACKQRDKDVENNLSDEAYIAALKFRQASLSLQWGKYEQLALLRLDIKRLKLAQKRVPHKQEDKIALAESKYDALKAELDTLNVAVESLKPDPLSSFLPEFLKEDEDEYDSDYLIGQLNKANGRRLFWVWTRCLIEAVLITAHEALLVSTMIAAWVSWSLYWFRGGVTAAAAVWHSYDSLVTERERAIASHKRAWAQWSARYDDILNDLIWGSANFACCFWLIGAGVLGTIGDSLTLVLLGMDLLLSGLRWLFGKRGHREMMMSYDQQSLSVLDKILASVQASSKEKDLVEQLKATCEAYYESQSQAPFFLYVSAKHQHANALAAAKKRIYALHQELSIELNKSEHPQALSIQVLSLHWEALFNDEQAYLDRWNSKWSKLNYDVIYAVALAVAFGLMCFSPIAGLALFGAVFLSASTVVWRTAYAKDDIIDEMGQAIHLDKQQYQEKLDAFIQLGNQLSIASDETEKQQLNLQMKPLYLQLRTVGAKHGYDQELRWFKIVEFSRETTMRILVPVAIALTLLLAPATIATIPSYVFLMLGVLLTAVLLSACIHRYVKPKTSSWEKSNGLSSSTACFDEGEYSAFKDAVLVSKTQDSWPSELSPLAESEEGSVDLDEGQKRGQTFFAAMQRCRVKGNQQLMQQTCATMAFRAT